MYHCRGACLTCIALLFRHLRLSSPNLRTSHASANVKGRPSGSFTGDRGALGNNNGATNGCRWKVSRLPTALLLRLRAHLANYRINQVHGLLCHSKMFLPDQHTSLQYCQELSNQCWCHPPDLLVTPSSGDLFRKTLTCFD